MDTNLKDAMEQRMQEIRKNEQFIDIKLKIDGYRHHNNTVKKEMKERLLVLDTKYSFYNKIINNIQISIIILSSGSTFLQASKSQILLSESNINLISLYITTYTALLLTISKYMKYDEKKEILHNLRVQFAEFLITIQTRNDKLNTWQSDNFWAGANIESRQTEWTDLENKLKEELCPIIEKKQILCSEFEKALDSESKSKFAIFSRKKELIFNKAVYEIECKEQQLQDKKLQEQSKNISESNSKSIFTFFSNKATHQTELEETQLSNQQEENNGNELIRID